MSRARRLDAAYQRAVLAANRDEMQRFRLRLSRSAIVEHLGAAVVIRGDEYVIRDGLGHIAWMDRAPDWLAPARLWGHWTWAYPAPLPVKLRRRR